MKLVVGSLCQAKTLRKRNPIGYETKPPDTGCGGWIPNLQQTSLYTSVLDNDNLRFRASLKFFKMQARVAGEHGGGLFRSTLPTFSNTSA